MQRLSESQKQFLWESTKLYRGALPGSPAAEYLESRGLSGPEVTSFALGYVAEPLPGHEMYRGFLAIPYLRRTLRDRFTVATIRFRCLAPECLNADDGAKERHQGHGKYLTVTGGGTRLYNPPDLLVPSGFVCLTEGELDAITLHLIGLPAVAVPGSETWQRHWRDPLLGYETVYIPCDGDEAGMKFAKKTAKELPNAKIIPMPDGEDVNSVFVKDGAESVLKRFGLSAEETSV